MVAGFVLAVIGCTVGAVWLCVTLMLRRAGPGH
jgi:hypothetical protein